MTKILSKFIYTFSSKCLAALNTINFQSFFSTLSYQPKWPNWNPQHTHEIYKIYQRRCSRKKKKNSNGFLFRLVAVPFVHRRWWCYFLFSYYVLVEYVHCSISVRRCFSGQYVIFIVCICNKNINKACIDVRIMHSSATKDHFSMKGSSTR